MVVRLPDYCSLVSQMLLYLQPEGKFETYYQRGLALKTAQLTRIPSVPNLRQNKGLYFQPITSSSMDKLTIRLPGTTKNNSYEGCYKGEQIELDALDLALA